MPYATMPDDRRDLAAIDGEQPARHGVALALSGGGFRAALFHLGALRRLNELGVLSQVDTIPAVSGGSIVAAHLATCVPAWPAPGAAIAAWEETVAAPFRAFCGHNLRTRPLLRRLWPGNWRRGEVAVEALARAIAGRLTPHMLDRLPSNPRYVFCATDMTFGVNWVFDSGPGRMGDYQAGYAPLPPWPLARAVAVSACFPPVFDSLPLDLDPATLRGGSYRGVDRDELVRSLRLGDGGLYDNLGLEPVWKSHRSLLVSDGGGVFAQSGQGGVLWRVQRATQVIERQGRALRRRWLMAGFGGAHDALEVAYWGIASATRAGDDAATGYSAAVVSEVIGRVRTDLDAFSAAEQGVLENHGYLAAEASVRRRVPGLIRRDAPLAVPHPALMDEATVRRELAGSHRRTLPGRW